VPRVCVFDVNETLLDLGSLDPQFERVFGDASARQAWFGQFLTSWLTAMVTGVYQEFGTMAAQPWRWSPSVRAWISLMRTSSRS
jgi:2-haloacid dehalogenase